MSSVDLMHSTYDSTVDDRDLRWLILLADTEHVSLTAARLGVPQPTVSRALARLEADLGARLFDRIGNRLRLNAGGRVAVEHARRAVQEVDTARELITELNHPDRGLIRLGLLATMGESSVPGVLSRYRLRAPGVRFVLQEGHSDDIIDWIREGRVDLAFTGRLRPGTAPEGKDIAWSPIERQHLHLAVPQGHRLTGGGPVDLAEVAHEPFITFWARAELRLLTEYLCRQAGFTPEVVVQTGEVATARALVAAGLGIAVVPPPAAVLPPAALPPPNVPSPAVVTAAAARPVASGAVSGIVHLPLADPAAERQVGIAWPTRTAPTPAVARFLAFLRDGEPGTDRDGPREEADGPPRE